MNKETYEALKRVVSELDEPDYERGDSIEHEIDIKQVKAWIDEVAKEYDESWEAYEDSLNRDITNG